MSWYVYQLLSNRQLIKASLYQQKGIIDLNGDIAVVPESDTFDDLLSVETKIFELDRAGLFTQRDKDLLVWIEENQPLSRLSEVIDINRKTLAKEIREFCDKLGFLLGDKFTDAGYLNYLQDKHHLTDEEILAVRLYMEGKFRTYRGKNENTK